MSTSSKYRPEIDGLRAFAVVAVIINHFNKDALPGGYLGVDIFFVISGYVITSSLYGRSSTGFGDFIGGFYERRIKRLVPALTVFVLITSAVICFFNPEPKDSLKTGIAALFGWSNLNLLAQSTDYFAYSTEFNVFTHTWSLGVEEQFYVLFPLLVWYSGFGRQSRYGSRNLFLIVSGLSIVSLLGFVYLYSVDQSVAYFSMPSRFWEMATGCLLFVALRKRASFKKCFENISPLLVFVFMVLAMYLPISFAVSATIAVVVLTAILIASLKESTAAFKIFTHPKIIYIGLISYSLYLWHWGVLSISRWTIGIHWWSIPIQLILMFTLAIASYQWIETPFRNRTWYGGRLLSILCGVFVLFVSFLTLFLFKNVLSSSMFSRFNNVRVLDRKSNQVPFSLGRCIGHKELSSDDVNLIFENCKRPSLREIPGQSTLAFVGDSHGLNLLKGSKIFSVNQFRLLGYFYAGCPFPYPNHGYDNAKCSDFLQRAEKALLADLREGDYIVIFNYHLSHLGSESFGDVRHNLFDIDGNLPEDMESKLQIYSSSLERFVSAVSSEGITVFLVGSPFRLLGYDSRLSAQQFENNMSFAVNIRIQESYAKKMNQGLKRIASGNRNIVFVDPIDILSHCSSSLEIFSICFIDSDHLSTSSAIEINEFIYGKVTSQ